jgi:hypothetical protein
MAPTRASPFRIRRTLETGLFGSYARAFNESRGNPQLPAAPTSGLSWTERKTHRWALNARDEVWTHVDRGAHRRTTDVQEGIELASVEPWIRPSPQQLAELAALAENLAERYVREATDLAKELRN